MGRCTMPQTSLRKSKSWQLRGLLAWPASPQSEDRKDVGGLACAFPSSLARVGNPSSLSRAGIQGLEPRVRAWSRGGIQPLAGTRTSLGFPALQGLTTWTVRWISPVRSPLALGRTAQVVPEPQGINGSSSRQGFRKHPTTLRKSNATPATCLALVGFLPSCSHQLLRPWSVRAHSQAFRPGKH